MTTSRLPDGTGLKIVLLALLASLVAGAVVNVRLWADVADEPDIYYAWLEGQRMLDGQNPYERVLAGDMRNNDKYATYFPLFYELSYVTQLAGLRDYPQWIAAWRVVFLGFYLAVAGAMFWSLYRRRLYAAAVLAVLLWLFNRWTMLVIHTADLDFVPIFLLIVSLELFEEHRWASLLLFGCSLAVKQIAMFVAPLYLIWIWREAGGGRNAVRQVAISGAVLASIPLLTSLPFIAWNAVGFVKSVLFSVTRDPEGYLAVDGVLGWVGIPARLPMLVVTVLVYLIAWRRQAGIYTSTLLVMAAFAGLNSVFFMSYVLWVIPFIPLVMCDLADRGRPNDQLLRNPTT